MRVILQGYYRIRTMQEKFDVSRWTIYRWVEQGKLPPPVKNGNTNLWVKEEVDGLDKQMFAKREVNS